SAAETEVVNAYLNSADLPFLAAPQRELKADTTIEEPREALSKINRGKAPGQDSFPVEFYQAYGNQLAELLLAVFREARESGLLPGSLREEVICIIPKKGEM
ncbi:hypothetical protein NDU88_003818, partial [Pleurodeles waltl]